MPSVAGALDWNIAADAVDTRLLPPDVASTGANGALKRTPRVDVQSAGLLGPVRFVPSWKPYWPKLKTAGLKFPDGIELAPVMTSGASAESLRPIAPAQPPAGGGQPPRKPTRVRPPARRSLVAGSAVLPAAAPAGILAPRAGIDHAFRACFPISTKASPGCSHRSPHCWPTRWASARRCRRLPP